MIQLLLIALYLILFSTEVQAIGVSNNYLGNYLVTDEGMTLYYFSGDFSGDSNCYGYCMDNWRPFHTEYLNIASAEINAYDFSTIAREDNMLQTTYRDRPLYLYGGDKYAGDINGQGLNNMWFIARI